MNPAHLHLIINHVPVIGTMITLFILAIGIIKKSDDVKKVAMLVLILTSVITIPVYVSGGNAEEMVEGAYEDVDESFIDAHEDFALYSFIAMDIVGAIAILSMFLYKKPKELSNSFAMIMFVLLLIVNGMMGYTSHLGGKIHHPEMRDVVLPWDKPSPTSDTGGKEKTANEKDEKDKDKDDD